MPTYDYVCNECGHEFEAFQSIKAEPLSNCPNCQGEVRRKIGSGVGLILREADFTLRIIKKTNSSPGTSKSERSESSKNESSNSDTSKESTKKPSETNK